MPFPPCPLIRYLQLATVQPDGRPANRTVVFRWDSYRLPCTAHLVRNLHLICHGALL